MESGRGQFLQFALAQRIRVHWSPALTIEAGCISVSGDVW